MTPTAVILSGAVAKGAFEAGVLSVLAEESSLDVRRVVGSSSGALNGAVYAAGLHTGRPKDAAAQIVEMWRDEAGWRDVFKPDVLDILQLRGVGTHGHVLDLMKRARAALPGRGSGGVELRIVLTNLAGTLGSIHDEPATTFSSVRAFQGDAFDRPDGWEVICRTALGSAALPIVYAPVDVPGVGPCLDGGLLNNTPIKQAIDGGEIARIVVVCAHPRRAAGAPDAKGLALASEFVDFLVNERLYRDLRDAYDINDTLGRLEQLREQGELGPRAHDAVRAVLAWQKLEIIEIRPEAPLQGSAISGFSDRTLRERYIEAGADRARAALPLLRG